MEKSSLRKVRNSSRVLKGLETKRKLVQTAIELFARDGFDKVTVDDICRKVGVTKGAFYNHFKSKDEVILEEFKVMDDHYLQVERRLASLDDPLEKLRVFHLEAIKLMADMGVTLMKVVYHSQIAPHMRQPYLDNRDRALYRITHDIVREGQEKGFIPPQYPPEYLASILINAFRGQIYHWCLSNGGFDLVKQCSDMAELLIECFRAYRESQREKENEGEASS
jgi:AcrR family transcriptional regulator